MAFDGDPITDLAPLKLKHDRCTLIIVSGDGPNLAGHMLVEIPAELGGTDSIFHIAGLYQRPHWMAVTSFPRYLKETGKAELGRKPITLTQPREGEIYLQKAIKKEWAWGGLINNCVSFCEEYIAAGGSEFSMASNAPVFYDTKNPKEFIEGWIDDVTRRGAVIMWQMENEIMSLYTRGY